MRFLLVLGVALVGVTSSASATPIFTTLDQPNDVVDVNADEVGYPQRLAQAFVPAAGGTARSVSVYGQTRFQSGPSSVVLAIRADNNGNPGALLGQGTAPINETTGLSPSCADLDVPANLVAGQTYYVTFAPNGGGQSWLFQRQAYKQVQKSYEVEGGWDQNSGGPQKTMSMHVDDAGCGPELRSNPVDGTTLGDMFAQSGGTAFQTLTLHNDGPQPLTVLSAGFAGPDAAKFDVLRGEPGTINGQSYNFPQTIGSGSQALTFLYIACIGDGPDGLRTATLNVDTNDADEPRLLFGVECLVDSTPPSLAFSQVPDGLSGWWVTKPAPLKVEGLDPESGGRVIFITCRDDNGPQQIHDSSPTAQFSYTAEGVHNLACWGRDAAQNRSIDLPETVKVDTEAPTTAQTGSPLMVSAVNDPEYVFEGADATSGLLGFQCRLDTEAFAPCTSPATSTDVSDGTHTFEVRAQDSAGNLDATPGQYTFTVDTTAPNSTITSGPDPATRERFGTFEYAATDAISGVSYLECSFDDEPFSACTSPYVGTEKADGIHNLRIRGVDGLGNVETTPARREWGVDNVPPQSVFTSKPEASTAGPDAGFAFAGSQLGAAGVASWSCMLDGEPYAPCASPVTLTGLAPARDHTFSVVATDVVGQVQTEPTTYAWTITDDPLARPDAATTTAGESVDIDVLANDFVAVAGARSLGTFDAVATAGGTVAAVDGKLRFLPASGFDGTDTFTYRVKDAQGQESAPATVTVTVAPRPPTPTVTSEPTASTTPTVPATPSPTATATASSTVAATGTPTSGATPEPTASSTPPAPGGGSGLPGVGPDTPALPDRRAPVLSALKLRKRTLRFAIDEAGTVTIVIRKGSKRVTRKVRVTKAGTAKLKIPRTFRKGRVRLKLTAVDDAGNASAPLSASRGTSSSARRRDRRWSL